MEASSDTVAELRKRLLDPSLPIERRFRSLFSLRNLRGGGPREALEAALEDDSCLLAHEAAFALGQMQDVAAVPSLRNVLQSNCFHPMVRHEAAEALGAIGSSECNALLEAGLSDPAPEVRETCELALERIQQSASNGADSSSNTKPSGDVASSESGDNRGTSREGDSGRSPFLSVDPARPAAADASTEELRELLLKDGAPMYERYSALFALRNRRSPEAVQAVVAALQASSALLRHEVAYVLGQLQDRAAVQALMETLEKVEEHPMVRHEAAEALGAIADMASVELLRKFQKDPEPIVSQSCDVALDMLEFELQEGAFQYADVKIGNEAPSAMAGS